MEVVGLALFAAALPVAGPGPITTNSILTYKRLLYKTSLLICHADHIVLVLHIIQHKKRFVSDSLTSSWMAGGSAAKNSGLTSVTPGPPRTGPVEEGRLVATGGREGGLMPS